MFLSYVCLTKSFFWILFLLGSLKANPRSSYVLFERAAGLQRTRSRQKKLLLQVCFCGKKPSSGPTDQTKPTDPLPRTQIRMGRVFERCIHQAEGIPTVGLLRSQSGLGYRGHPAFREERSLDELGGRANYFFLKAPLGCLLLCFVVFFGEWDFNEVVCRNKLCFMFL